MLPWRPDLVVTGINHGQNAGEDTIYSGTVAGAMEGYLFDIPAIAFSQVEKGWAELDSAAEMAREIVVKVYEKLPKPFLLNVNIPNRPYSELKKICATRLGRRHESEAVIREKDPFDREIFWIGPTGRFGMQVREPIFMPSIRGMCLSPRFSWIGRIPIY